MIREKRVNVNNQSDKNSEARRSLMLKHRKVFMLTFGFLLLVVFSLVFVPAVTTVCAEKTKSGAWCQNVPEDQVAAGFRKASTSCEATSFCKMGTCVDSAEGTCEPNVPQRVCQDNEGVWVAGKPDTISQCQLGCCLLGDQAAFVTQTKCKSLSSDYGTTTNYRTDIKTEAACIASANPDVKGACVLDDGFVRNCRMLTQSECQNLEASQENTTIEFHEGFLCSAEILGTNCGPTSSNPRTTCVENKDEVYFLDTCGNIANIYDATKINDKSYWTEIIERDESCNPSSSNAGSRTCGSCDYLSGSTCKPVQRGNQATPQPQYGNFVCADLSCRYQGKDYQHGETWCGGTQGINQSLPGSESTRFVCYDGEVTIEQCSVGSVAGRAKICIEDSIPTDEGNFRVASCRINRWQEPGGCISQDNKADCENTDSRDCKWIIGQSVLRDEQGRYLILNENGELVQKEEGGVPTVLLPGIKISKGAACVPKYAPGFDFWNPEGEAEELCAVVSDTCTVKFTKSLLGGLDWDCKENCECLGLKEGDPPGKAKKDSPWANERNNMCISLGDCGNKENYIGVQGYSSPDSVIIESKDG